MLRTAFRTRARLVCHLVFLSFFFFFFVTRHTQLDVEFCVPMISATEHRKTLLPTQDRSTTGPPVPFLVGSFLGVFVGSREAPENGDMRCFIVQ